VNVLAEVLHFGHIGLTGVEAPMTDEPNRPDGDGTLSRLFDD